MKSKILLPVIVSLFLFACNKPQKNKEELDTLFSGDVNIACDQGLQPVITAEEQVFEALYTSANVNIKYASEAEALDLFLKDSVRMAIATRPLTENEVKMKKGEKQNPRSILFAIGGIALITHRDNKDSLITVNNLRDICTGKITKWNQLYKTSNLGNVQVVFNNSNSGIVRFVKDSICGKEALSEKLSALNNSEEVIKYISEHKNAMGIIDAPYISNWRDSITQGFREDIRIMAVSKANVATPDNSFQPYQAYLATGDYPLAQGIYIILNDLRPGLVNGFTNFICKEKGQRIILKAGILPATQPVRLVKIKEE